MDAKIRRRNAVAVKQSGDNWQLIHQLIPREDIADGGIWYDDIRDIADITPMDVTCPTGAGLASDSYGEHFAWSSRHNSNWTCAKGNQHWGNDWKMLIKYRIPLNDTNRYALDFSSVGSYNRGFGIGYTSSTRLTFNLKLNGTSTPANNYIDFGESILGSVIEVELTVYSQDSKTGARVTVKKDGATIGAKDFGTYINRLMDFGGADAWANGNWLLNGANNGPFRGVADWYKIQIFRKLQ